MASYNAGGKCSSVIPECEVITEEGGPDAKILSELCTKHPGHVDFIPVKEFTPEHIPEAMNFQGAFENIKNTIERTVLLQVRYTSVGRPDTYDDGVTPYPYSKFKGSKTDHRCATGTLIDLPYAYLEMEGCPCRECRYSGNPKKDFWTYFVVTATHVIYDELEAESTIIHCFYDSEEDKEQVIKLYGINILDMNSQRERYDTDYCDGVVCVTHDEESANIIDSRIYLDPSICFQEGIELQAAFIVSHPHGLSKRISFGNMLSKTVCNSREESVLKHKKRFVSSILSGKGLDFFPQTEEDLSEVISTICFTDEAKYAMKYHYDTHLITFPAGTTLAMKDGTTIQLSDHAIDTEGFEIFMALQPQTMFYNVPTCPGSSGAKINHTFGQDHALAGLCAHRGLDTIENCNCSCTADLINNFSSFNRLLQLPEEVVNEIAEDLNSSEET